MAILRGFGEWLKETARLPWGQLAEKTIEATEATAEFGEAWREYAPKLEQLKDLDKIDAFFQRLGSPVVGLAVGALPFASLGLGMLRLYWEVTKTEPTLESSVAIAAQMAYLESLGEALKQADEDTKAKLEAMRLTAMFERQLKKLETVDVSFAEATSTLNDFPGCALSKALNDVLKGLLTELGVSPAGVGSLMAQVGWGTPQYFYVTVARLKDKVPELKQYLNSGGQTVQDKYASIERYLKRCIDLLPKEQVFDEADPKLTFEELYVPLSVQRLDLEGKDTIGSPLHITDWARGVLESPVSEREVMFIQGEAGRGKSVFCRMFASWVRERFSKAWVPILIRLRDVHKIKDNLSETLKIELENEDFVQSDRGWLTDPNVRFLLIFDGFDELLLERRESDGLKDFLQQVAKFQKGCHHQCLVTGRPLALQGIDKQLTRLGDGNLQRVRLEPMTDTQREQWLVQWGQKFAAAEAIAFCNFLKACPDEISNVLAREPLLLYLLGRLHRENRLKAQMFAGAEGIQAKVRVYDESVKWVLARQRQELNKHISGLELKIEDLRQVLQEVALCVVQSGNETAKLTMLKRRFTDSANPVAELLKQAQTETEKTGDKALNNLLTAFYLKPGKGDRTGSVEFAHKSFGEFLFAERLKHAFGDWTELDECKRLRLSDAEVSWQIYDLLGYGSISRELIVYLRQVLLSSSDCKSVHRLFERLKQFYESWAKGYYIDRPPNENLPQRKMIQLTDADIYIGIRQIDIHAGLNVLMLLVGLHRDRRFFTDENADSSLIFHPCGSLVGKSFDAARQLLRIYQYCQSVRIRPANFLLVGANLERIHLTGIDLSHALLKGTNFWGANLRNANFFGADLRKATFQGADLTGCFLFDSKLTEANLSHASIGRADFSQAVMRAASLVKVNVTAYPSSYHVDAFGDVFIDDYDYEVDDFAYNCFQSVDLTDADLSGANLSKSDFSHANLSGANLSGAWLFDSDLSHAQLKSANLADTHLNNVNLDKADLKDISYNEETNWDGVKGLDTAENVPSALKQQLGLT